MSWPNDRTKHAATMIMAVVCAAGLAVTLTFDGYRAVTTACWAAGLASSVALIWMLDRSRARRNTSGERTEP